MYIIVRMMLRAQRIPKPYIYNVFDDVDSSKSSQTLRIYSVRCFWKFNTCPNLTYIMVSSFLKAQPFPKPYVHNGFDDFETSKNLPNITYVIHIISF